MSEENTYNPLISVILPVYNAENYINESIESILAQSLTDFELIIINDGSKDKSADIIKSYSDARIVYIEQQNMGLANTLNKALSIAKGKYIARQDNDDISCKDRFKKQVEFLETNPSIALLGTWAKIIDEQGNDTGRSHKHTCNSDYLKLELVFDNPFVHSSIMAKKECLLSVGGYDSSNDIFEDHNFWSRISYRYKVANLPEELLMYREVNTGMSKSTSTYSIRVSKQCQYNLNHYLPNLINTNSVVAEVYHSINANIINADIKLFENTLAELVNVLMKSKSSFEKQKNIKLFLLKFKLNLVRKRISLPSIKGLELLLLKIKRRLLVNELKKYNVF
jgi:glycosyltransferase involved in cell wall biosynthesis